MRSFNPLCARNSRYADAVVAKPSGTRTPALASWLIISPREEFLPPTESTSVERSSVKSMTLACWDMDAGFWWC